LQYFHTCVCVCESTAMHCSIFTHVCVCVKVLQCIGQKVFYTHNIFIRITIHKGRISPYQVNGVFSIIQVNKCEIWIKKLKHRKERWVRIFETPNPKIDLETLLKGQLHFLEQGKEGKYRSGLGPLIKKWPCYVKEA